MPQLLTQDTTHDRTERTERTERARLLVERWVNGTTAGEPTIDEPTTDEPPTDTLTISADGSDSTTELCFCSGTFCWPDVPVLG